MKNHLGHAPIIRLLSKIETCEDLAACWKWRGSVSELGYGAFWFDGAMRPAHRVTYELLIGPVPDGLELDHLCRNRGCVNPSHVEPVTHQENCARKPAWPACKWGHERVIGQPCRTCKREEGERYRRAKGMKTRAEHLATLGAPSGVTA